MSPSIRSRATALRELETDHRCSATAAATLRTLELNVDIAGEHQSALRNASPHYVAGYHRGALRALGAEGQVTASLLAQAIAFDAALRLAILALLGPIEMKLRSEVVRHLVAECGVDAHLRPEVFSSESAQSQFLTRYERALLIAQGQPALGRYRTAYGDLPLDVVVDLLELGALVRLVGSLGNLPLRKRILAEFAPYKHRFVQGWLESAVRLRNTCAHHHRILFARLPAGGALLRQDSQYAGQMLFSALIACSRLYGCGWGDRQHEEFIVTLRDLFVRYPTVRESWLGFPDEWEPALRGHPH